jgi:hypothetical protein
VLLRRVLVATVVALAVVGCRSGSHPVAAPHHPVSRATNSPRPPSTPPTQTGWMHGVGVDVPRTWPRDQLRCGQPARTTLVVQSVGAVFPTCFWPAPKTLRPDVVWIGGYAPPLRPASALGVVEVPARGLAAMTPLTIAGEPAREWLTHSPRTGEPAVLIVLPRRSVFVAVSSTHRSIRDSVVASIHVVDSDPATGCATRSSAYDAPPRHPMLDRPIDVAGAVSVVGCHYVAGWLETTAASMPAAKLRALVRAVNAAPHVTAARAPDDTGCERVDLGPPALNDDGPVVLRFSLRDGRTVVVVARVVYCTRWQSYLYAGNLERRLTGTVLLAMPRLLDQFPDPDSM